jgi:type I site-specific restriction-modification system R (restriction) subunit
MTSIKVDPETGEIIPENIMVRVETAPAISIDISYVAEYHKEPQKLIDMISQQAGFAVFGDMQDKKQRKACASHAASIIRCITPAADESKRMASEAKKIVNQDLSFRRDFEAGVREVATFHRKPLTDWEEEQAKLEAEQLAREDARLAAEKLEIDHQDAIDFDELFTLRKQREIEAERVRLEAKAIEDKRLFDEAVARKIESERLQMEAQARRNAEAEQVKLLEAEREEIRRQERAFAQEEAEKDRQALAELAIKNAEAQKLIDAFKEEAEADRLALIKHEELPSINLNPDKVASVKDRIIRAVADEFNVSSEVAEDLIKEFILLLELEL